MSESRQLITLTIPGGRRYVGIVRMFVGGLAARLGLGYDAMADLQLALESVFGEMAADGDVTLEAHIENGGISILVGPLDGDPLQAHEAGSDTLELQRLLAALVTGAESISRDGRCWLRLDVLIPAGSSSA